jgi:hypothetical protein
MNLFKKYKAKRETEIQERKARQEQSKKDAVMEADKATLNMLSKPCAVKDFTLCNPECVHWERGCVAFWPDFNDFGNGRYYAVRPKCRLWGGK